MQFKTAKLCGNTIGSIIRNLARKVFNEVTQTKCKIESPSKFKQLLTKLKPTTANATYHPLNDFDKMCDFEK